MLDAKLPHLQIVSNALFLALACGAASVAALWTWPEAFVR
jgi:hypothetical protein